MLAAGWLHAVNVEDGELVPQSARLVFTATPTVGYYVSGWTGDCENNATATTGGDDAPGTPQTCEVAPGSADVAAGATFAAIADCSPLNRVNETATTCGACELGRATADSGDADDGTVACSVETCADTTFVNGGTVCVPYDIIVDARNCDDAGWRVDKTHIVRCHVPLRFYPGGGANQDLCRLSYDGRNYGCRFHFGVADNGGADIPDKRANHDSGGASNPTRFATGCGYGRVPDPGWDGVGTQGCVCPQNQTLQNGSCACPAGLVSAGESGHCVPSNRLGNAQKCLEAGWDVLIGSNNADFDCNIPYWDRFANNIRRTSCTIPAVSADISGGCYIFGGDENNFVTFPRRSDQLGANAAYAILCSQLGGQIPDPNWDYQGNQECVCPLSGQVATAENNHTCACPTGTTSTYVYQSFAQLRADAPVHQCVAADSPGLECRASGWHYYVGSSGEKQCLFDRDFGSAGDDFDSDGATLENFQTGARDSRCGLGDSLALQCADIFGDDIPDRDDTGPVIVYNCPTESSDLAADRSTCECKEGYAGERCEISQTCAARGLYADPANIGACAATCPDGYQNNPDNLSCELCALAKTNSTSVNGEPCACGSAFPVESFDGASCAGLVGGCEAGEFLNSVGEGLFKCAPCAAGTYGVGGSCVSCGAGDTGGESASGGATTCECHAGNEKNGDGTCAEAERTVNIATIPEDGSGGRVVATVAGSEVADGGVAPGTHSVTFTAIPAGDEWRVARWTGACAADAVPPPVVASGDSQTCVVAPGVGDVSAGAEFGPADECEAAGRTRNGDRCGACATGYYNGTRCDDSVFAQSTFRQHCAAAGGLFGDILIHKFVQPRDGPEVLHICNFGSDDYCYVILHPDYNINEDVYGVYLSGTPTGGFRLVADSFCHVQFPACGAHETLMTGGNRFEGCTTTNDSCRGADENSVSDGRGGCSCPHGGSFVSGSSSGCLAELTRRAAVSANQAGGEVRASWAGLATPIGEGESGDPPASVAVTFTATPDADYYVSGWTGACLAEPNGAGSAPEAVLTCEIGPGTDAVEVGATFEAIADCAARKRTQTTATSCGGCIDDHAAANADDADNAAVACLPIASCAAGRLVLDNGTACGECDEENGYRDPTPDDGTVSCELVVCDSDLDEVRVGTSCECREGEARTSGNPNSSGACVVASDLPVANACERAEWRLDAGRDRCVIAHKYVENNIAVDDCVLERGCLNVFDDTDNDSIPDFPQYDAALDEPTPRRFVVYCGNGQEPSSRNDAGQTECVTFPIVSVDPVADGGALSVSWTGVAGWPSFAGDDDLQSGDKVPPGARITFTATPADADHYVAWWTGACESSGAATGADDSAGGAAKTCEITAERGTDIAAGVIFEEIVSCESLNREERSGAVSCGACLPTFEDSDASRFVTCECPSGTIPVSAFLSGGDVLANTPDQRCAASDSLGAECAGSGWDYLNYGGAEICDFGRDGSALSDSQSGRRRRAASSAEAAGRASRDARMFSATAFRTGFHRRGSLFSIVRGKGRPAVPRACGRSL